MVDPPTKITRLRFTVVVWWREESSRVGIRSTFLRSLRAIWDFASDSVPWNRRQHYGDADFDWNHRVDTTSATVGWRERLVGVLNSPYQPTEEQLFREMLGSLNLDFRNFVFIDIGSGKGRVLLMASSYPFRGIVGVELLPAFHRVAVQNITKYKNASQLCHKLESICADARNFVFPDEPTVLYLFNPLPAHALVDVLHNLEQSLQTNPRRVYVIYHNPEHEHLFTQCLFLQKIGGTHQYSLFSN